ncbi:MAG: glycosyl transferase, partial [Coriobacteriia bacterium]|nr:glycosyl transferase [Coriobacteriia bacterium]
MSHVLLITYEFPPKGGPGVRRPLKTAKYLSRLGWDVTVLTVKDPLGGMMDESLLDELPDEVSVERAWSLEPTRLVAAVRRLRGGGGVGQATGAGSRGYSSLPGGAIRFVQAFFIPDE